MDNSEKLNHVSLCTGYGGIDLGLKRTLGNVRTVAYVEIEAYAVENLVNKIEANLLDVAPIWTDLKTFEWERFSRRVDILSGGFPCQPFSAAGRRQGDNDPRHLWPYIVDGIKRLHRPSIIFFENVEGIINARLRGNEWNDRENTPVLLHVLREMERMGYRSTAGIFSASEIGAPHQRKRVFILGIRNELKQSGIDFINGLIKSNECNKSTAWPASKGQEQYKFEPPRFSKLGDSDSGGKKPYGIKRRILQKKTETREANRFEWTNHLARPQRQTESQVGRNVNGRPYRLDYAELYKSNFNRIDELRLLGNGVIPAVADRAFKLLWQKLAHARSYTKRR